MCGAELAELSEQLLLVCIEVDACSPSARTTQRWSESRVGDRVGQHARELSVVPDRVDQNHPEVLVGRFDGDSRVSHESANEVCIGFGEVARLSLHDGQMLIEMRGVAEEAAGVAMVSLEEIEGVELLRTLIVLEQSGEVCAASRVNGELGQIGFVVRLFEQQALFECADESHKASGGVVEVLFAICGELRGGWSTDEAEAVGEEVSLERREGFVGEEVVDASAADQSVEPEWRVRPEPMKPAI